MRGIGLKSEAEWKAYCKSGNKPPDIPSKPDHGYAGKGWAGYVDWLGYVRVFRRADQYRSFEESRAFARGLGLKSRTEWQAFGRSGKRPADIPANPNRAYADDWVGFGDWLGTGSVSNRLRRFQPFKEARTFARSLGMKTWQEWTAYCKSGKRPTDIPSNPSKAYADAGWAGFGDWLGTGRSFRRHGEMRPFRDARNFARKLGLKSSTEWRDFCKSGKRPADIPSNPNIFYKDDG